MSESVSEFEFEGGERIADSVFGRIIGGGLRPPETPLGLKIRPRLSSRSGVGRWEGQSPSRLASEASAYLSSHQKRVMARQWKASSEDWVTIVSTT